MDFVEEFVKWGDLLGLQIAHQMVKRACIVSTDLPLFCNSIRNVLPFFFF